MAARPRLHRMLDEGLDLPLTLVSAPIGDGESTLVASWVPTLDLANGAIEGGEMDIYSLAINWFADTWFDVSFNYRHIVLDRRGLKGHSDGLMGRIVLMLE